MKERARTKERRNRIILAPLSNKKEATFKITLLDGLEAILLQFQLPQHVQDGEGLLGDGRELVAAQVEPF